MWDGCLDLGVPLGEMGGFYVGWRDGGGVLIGCEGLR